MMKEEEGEEEEETHRYLNMPMLAVASSDPRNKSMEISRAASIFQLRGRR
jgi:hypothetical protein